MMAFFLSKMLLYFSCRISGLILLAEFIISIFFKPEIILPCHSLCSGQALSPPFPTLPPRSQNGTGRQPRLKQGSGVRVVSGCTPNPAPPVLAPSWWPWGPWLGWVPGFEGGQGCWPELAWRSHSSPGKAENRRPLCPGVLSATLLALPP